jgi:hypothetical protein
MDSKRIRLRYPATCARCGTELAKGEEAWWSAQAHAVTCFACIACAAEPNTVPTKDATASPPSQSTVADRSAQAEYERRHQRDRDRVERQWGRLAGVVEFLRDEPQTTTAWAKGAQGERRVTRRLDTLEVNGAVLMHDRKDPHSRGNIDHLAIATSGVWVIDAKNLSGTVECRNNGSWLTPDRRLYVGGRDRTKLITGLTWQVETIRRALGGLDWVPIHPVVCIIAEWLLLPQTFELDGVQVLWPGRLAKLIVKPGPLTNIIPIVDRLAATLAPA